MAIWPRVRGRSAHAAARPSPSDRVGVATSPVTCSDADLVAVTPTARGVTERRLSVLAGMDVQVGLP
jgi:hypothetical protein